MNSTTEDRLKERTAFLERELGPCLLVLKCRELLGHNEQELRPLAKLVVRGEIERLSEARRRKLGIRSLCEHHVRAVYASSLAGYSHDGRALFASLLDTLHRHCKPESVPANLALSVASAAVFAKDCSRGVSALSPGTPAASIVTAVSSGNDLQLSSVIESLRELILVAELESQIAPWDDVWVYVLLRRLVQLSNPVEKRA